LSPQICESTANLFEYNSRFIPVSVEETDEIFIGEGRVNTVPDILIPN
jgi:hypothetical protein